MAQYTKYNPDQHAQDKALVLALIAERGAITRSDIWQLLHGQVTVGHVDRCLESLLREGRIRATKEPFTKPVDHPNGGRIVPYTATVYSVIRHDE